MQSIQAKIDDETARQLDAVIKHTGFRTRYELLRCLVTAFLHYADREGKEGVTLIASKSRVPLISMAVIGTEKWMDTIKHLHKPRITLRFGPAYELPRIDPDNREESLRAATDEVMCRIAALLPDHYHGFYSDNPRISELREEWASRGDMILPEE